MADPRISTAGYNPQSSNIPPGYVPCEEKNMYPGNYTTNSQDAHQNTILNQQTNVQTNFDKYPYDVTVINNDAVVLPSNAPRSWTGAGSVIGQNVVKIDTTDQRWSNHTAGIMVECSGDADTYPGTSTRHDEIIMTEIQPQESRPHKKLIDDDVLEGKDKPNDYKELAVLGCLFNFLFGLIALVMTFRSQESWKAGDRSKAKGYGLASMAMSVFAIISTAIIIFVVVWLFSLGGKDTISM